MYIKGHTAAVIILHLFAVNGVHVADADFVTTLSALNFMGLTWDKKCLVLNARKFFVGEDKELGARGPRSSAWAWRPQCESNKNKMLTRPAWTRFVLVYMQSRTTTLPLSTINQSIFFGNAPFVKKKTFCPFPYSNPLVRAASFAIPFLLSLCFYFAPGYRWALFLPFHQCPDFSHPSVRAVFQSSSFTASV